MRKFHIAAIFVGVVFLIFLIEKVGLGSLWRDFSLLGWGLVPFLFMEGAVDVFHALGWRFCLPPPYRTLSFARLFSIRLAGSAINFFTPTATLGGEVIKGVLLSSHKKGPEAATGVVIGKLSYVLSQLLFVTLGSLFLLHRMDLPAAASAALIAGSVLLGAGMVAFLIIQKKGKLGGVVRWLVAHKVGGEALRKAADQITEVDQALRVFYLENPGNLPRSMLWHAGGMVCSILKTWYFLVLMTDGSFSSAAGIWFLSTWLDLLIFFIPLGIGVQEGIYVFVFGALGFPLTLGLTYGVVIRLDQVLWATMGLLAYAVLLGRWGKGLASGERSTNEPPSPD